MSNVQIRCLTLSMLAAILLPAALLHGRQAPDVPDSTPAGTESVLVEATFDGAPFSYTMTLQSEEDGFRVYRLSYPSPVTTAVEQNNTVSGEYYLPANIGREDPKRPAVVCLHILNGNFELVRLLCSVLAARGIPAMMFKLPYYGERGPPNGRQMLLSNAELFADALQQTTQDVRRAVDFLASRPEVDPQRIGISGISLGGILAGSSAGMEPRLHRAGLILAGGDLLAIAHHARETRRLSTFIRQMPPAERQRTEETIRAVDPLSHTERLRELAEAGRVLMINAAEDEVVPRACTETLAKAIGLEQDVVWLEGLGHYTTMAALRRVIDATVEFFARDLPPGVQPAKPPVTPSTPLAMLAGLIRDLATMLAIAPTDGACHFLELSVTITGQGGKKHEGDIQFIRGAEERFLLRCRLPEIGTVVLGMAEYPWMASVGKKVFRGVTEPVAGGHPLLYVDPQVIMKVRMVGGVLGGVGVAPQVFEHMVDIARETDSDGATVIAVRIKQRLGGTVRVRFRADDKTPESAAFDVQGISGTVVFRQWQTHAVGMDQLFDEPRDLPSQDVSQQDVYRTFAGLAHFAAEKLQ